MFCMPAGSPIANIKNKMCNIRPGWNKYAAEEI